MKRDKGFPSEATLDLIRSLYCKRKATGTRDALRSEISTRLERFIHISTFLNKPGTVHYCKKVETTAR